MGQAALEGSIVAYINYLRHPEHLPKAGWHQLFTRCKQKFGDAFTLGRDRFCELMPRHNLMRRKRRFRPRTTDSRLNFKCYPDLVNTVPKITPIKPGELIVADITYVACNCDKGFAFLSTDAASCLGYHLHPNLEKEDPLKERWRKRLTSTKRMRYTSQN